MSPLARETLGLSEIYQAILDSQSKDPTSRARKAEEATDLIRKIGNEFTVWILVSLGIVSTTLGRASLRFSSRYNIPLLRDILKRKFDAVIWAHSIAYMTGVVNMTGTIVYFGCVENNWFQTFWRIATSDDGAECLKEPGNWSFNSENFVYSLFWGLVASIHGCILMTPGITMGSILGGLLIRRRLLINARKLQQQMTR